MTTLRIRNWDKWQSYRKDRGTPPWIKVHRRLMHDPSWATLSDAQRGQLVCIWMLAADRDGEVPDDPKVIRKLCCLDSEPDISALIAAGFLDAKVTPRRRQQRASATTKNEKNDAPETDNQRQISEAEVEKKNGAHAPTALSALNEVLDLEHAQAVIDHRKKKRAALTVYAAQQLAKKFALCPDPNAGADAMIANGWQGFDPSWLNGRSTGPPSAAKSSPFVQAARELYQEQQENAGTTPSLLTHRRN